MADEADIAQDYIDRTVSESVRRARQQSGPSRTHCLECEESIPEMRQRIGGVTRCIDCAELAERRGYTS